MGAASHVGLAARRGRASACALRTRADAVVTPIEAMPMTLRLTDDEQEALRAQAQREGISMQEAARRAVREYVERSLHRTRSE
jgi:predicted transcriptional regulator